MVSHGSRLSSKICSSHTSEVNWLNRTSSGTVVTLSEWHEVILRKGKTNEEFLAQC